MARGRPSLYKPEYVEQVKKLCLLGLTDEELAKFFGVGINTLLNWKSKYPDFLEALKEGKEQADADVAEKLYRRATGYSHPEVDIRVVAGEIVQTPLIKHYPPDTIACIYWLNNRRRLNWRQKAKEEDDGGVLRVVIENNPDADQD